MCGREDGEVKLDEGVLSENWEDVGLEGRGRNNGDAEIFNVYDRMDSVDTAKILRTAK